SGSSLCFLCHMNPEIKSALDYCTRRRLRQIILAAPFSLSIGELEELRKEPWIQGVIVKEPSTELWSKFTSGWLGAYLPHAKVWILPRQRGKRKPGQIVFAGSRMLITPRMLQTALLNGKYSLIYRHASGYCCSSVSRFFLWWLSDYMIATLRHASPSHPLMGVVKLCGRIPAARYVWHRVFRRGDAPPGSISMSGSSKGWKLGSASPASLEPAVESETNGESSEYVFRELLRRATDSARMDGQRRAIPARVVL